MACAALANSDRTTVSVPHFCRFVGKFAPSYVVISYVEAQKIVNDIEPRRVIAAVNAPTGVAIISIHFGMALRRMKVG